MRNKKIVTLCITLGLIGAVYGAYSLYSGTTDTVENTFSIVAGEENQGNAGTIKEPAWDSDGKAKAAAGLVPEQVILKDPYLVSNVDYKAYAFIRVEIPRFKDTENAGTDAVEILNLDADGKWKLISDTVNTDGKHELIYGYLDVLAGDNTSKPEDERAKTSSLFDSFKVMSIDKLEDDFRGSIDVTGALVQADGFNNVVEAAGALNYDTSGAEEIGTVTYVLNGGTLNGQKTSYSKNDYGYIPPTPVKEGYVFQGWSPESIQDNSTGEVTFTAQWKEDASSLKSGANLNVAFKKLAGNPNATYAIGDDKIKAIQKSDTEPSDDIKARSTNIASSKDEPIYAWFEEDTGTIKYWTKSKKIKLGESSRLIFNDMYNLTDISDIADWDASKADDFSEMFGYCGSLTDISALSNWDTSYVISMEDMFKGTAITNVDDLKNWSLNRATNISGMFEFCENLTDISALSNWDTSKITNITYIFYGCSSLTDISALSNWDTSKFEYIVGAFWDCTSLTDLNPIANWNTSNVTRVNCIFSGCTSLVDATPISGWDIDFDTTEGLGITNNAFADCTGLKKSNKYPSWYKNY